MPKSAEFNIYVRDRKPFVRFTGRAYVLPRTGQRGIPLVSVNTPSVNVNVFRIGDRNLIDTVLGLLSGARDAGVIAEVDLAAIEPGELTGRDVLTELTAAPRVGAGRPADHR